MMNSDRTFSLAVRWHVLVFAGDAAELRSTDGRPIGLPAGATVADDDADGRSGGQQVEVTITGEQLEDAESFRFSNPGITATPKLDDKGQRGPQYSTMITIAKIARSAFMKPV